jgi:glucose/arabinose dehydrogenase
VLDLPVIPGPNHDGGVILIDSQGLLYAMIGDLNHNGQLQNNPPGLPPDDTGVIFRVNQDGTAAAGNPFTPYCSLTTTQTCTATPDCPVGQTCVTNVARYYAYGVRNGFGLEFDPVTSALWMSENGPDIMDELNRIDAGVNSGWNKIMGPDALDPQGTGDLWNMPNEGLTYSDPEFSWMDTNAVTGVVFPFGTTWGPAYNDKVLVGDSNIGNIYSFPLNGTRTGLEVPALPPALQDLVADNQTEANLVRLGQGFGAITDLEKGPDDDIYVIDISGRVFRIEGPVPVTLQGFTVE